MSEARVRIYSRGMDSDNPEYQRAELTGLNREECERLEAVTHGQCWVKVGEDGRLEFRDARKPLPEPVEDKEMLGFWSHTDPRRRKVQLQLLDPERDPYCPHIVIQSLCGYHYTPENYEKEAGKLQSYGFECLRSRRGADGRFWEVWYLPGFWAARGEFKEVIDAVKSPPSKDGPRLDAAVSFLCRHVSFGTLDASVQRAAMVLEPE